MHLATVPGRRRATTSLRWFGDGLHDPIREVGRRNRRPQRGPQCGDGAFVFLEILAQLRIHAQLGGETFALAIAEAIVNPAGQAFIDLAFAWIAHDWNPRSISCSSSRPRWMRERTVPGGNSSTSAISS